MPDARSRPDPELMHRAVALALDNVRQARGGPFAALVARGGEVVATGTNLVTTTHDPTAHAEVEAIRAACRALGDFQLTGCDLYTTCEPCPMCLGAIYWARPARVFYAATRQDAAAAGFDDAFIYDEIVRPVEARQIPMVQVLRGKALGVFDAWRAKADRVDY